MEKKNNYGYIYKTTNLVNNKIYIGQRKGAFTNEYLGSGLLINRATKKRGKDKFKVKLLAKAYNKKELNELEIEYITKYKTLYPNKIYNISPGGQGGRIYDTPPHLGKRFSSEHKKRISLSHMGEKNHFYGKKHKDTSLHKMARAKLGKEMSEECKLMRSEKYTGTGNPFYGRNHTEETLKLLSEKCGRRGEHSSRFKDGRTLKKYYCIDCEKQLKSWRAKRCGKCASTFCSQKRTRSKTGQFV